MDSPGIDINTCVLRPQRNGGGGRDCGFIHRRGEISVNRIVLSLIALVSMPLAVWAQEQIVPAEVVEIVSIEAPVEKVWDAVKGFDQIHTWHPMFVTTELVEGEVTVPGAVRVLTLKDSGGKVTENLTSYDEELRTYSYIITESPMPVSEYASSIMVVDAGNGISTVEWKGKFLVPAEGGDEVVAMFRQLYRAGLDAVKINLEGA